MKSYIDGIKKEMSQELFDLFINADATAIITIDMHDGHLSTDPECPCPSLRGRDIIDSLNHFMEQGRRLNIPIINVRSILRKDGADEKLYPSAWRYTFPLSVGEIPNIAEHAKEGTRWNKFSIAVDEEKDYFVNTKKRLSAFYPTDLELLLRNLGIRTIVLTGCMTDCCVLNTAFDGANRDFRIIVPQDLTRGSEDLEQASLNIISRQLGLVVDSEDLVETWEKLKK
ncbi:MAG: cysteine hydrolase [Lachnospiraceae bacterium]|nr:cysteine hydrolase [Lachnospiraceae bacterium]